ANSDEFKRADVATQSKILANFQDFIRQTLNYLGEYMNQYKIVDDNLINSSYNLLYLLNIITFRHANLGHNLTELESIYQKLVTTISENISIYNSINKDKLSSA